MIKTRPDDSTCKYFAILKKDKTYKMKKILTDLRYVLFVRIEYISNLIHFTTPCVNNKLLLIVFFIFFFFESITNRVQIRRRHKCKIVYETR